MEEGTAHDGWNNEELRERERKVNILAFTELRLLLKIHRFTKDNFRKLTLKQTFAFPE